MTDWLARAVDRYKLAEGERRLKNGNHELYKDSKGIWTICHGWNIQHHGLPDSVCALLDDIIEDNALADLDRFIPWWAEAPDPAKEVLYDMMAGMGWGDHKRGLSTLVSFLTAMQAQDYRQAAALLWDPAKPRAAQRYKYSRDVGERAARNAELLLEAAADAAAG